MINFDSGNVNKKKCCFVAFFISLLFVIVLLRLYHYAPFGNKSLAWADGNIMYLDWFAYVKDVIHGDNSIKYTLSNALGGTYLAIFSTYISSPWNLLLALFEKTQLHNFLDLGVALKLSMASATAAYYLCVRFRLPFYILFCLSLSFGLGQYSFAQASNLIWFDGMYLLPVIAAGVYNNITEGRIRLLSVAVALSVISNWYTAGMNCLFSLVYLLTEYFLLDGPKTLHLFAKKMFRYASAMFIGLCLSAFLFLPTIALQREGVGQGFDWNFLGNEFKGNILSVIQYYSIGGTSTKTHVSLYCGSLPLIGCLLFYCNTHLNRTKKIVLSALLAFTVLMFYWQPLFFAFSLFKDCSSYWFRYSYIGIFSLVFIAAHFYEQIKNYEVKDYRVKPVIYFIVGLLVLNYDCTGTRLNYVHYTAAFIIIAYICLRQLSVKDNSRWLTVGFTALLVIITVAELGINAKSLMRQYHYEDVDGFITYERNKQVVINRIKEYDKGLYRISQTSARNMTSEGLTAHYNEPVAFNYPSISSYSSCPQNSQLTFLERLGYRTEFERIKVVNTSVLGADSLLGVKYLLSKNSIRGFEEMPRLSLPHDAKKVYVNKFALPMVFTFKSNALRQDNLASMNPFEYQNALYSQLVGKPVTLYNPVRFAKERQGNNMVYNLIVPNNESVIYGNIPWSRRMEAEIFKDKRLLTGYSRWLSPSVFYIPTLQDEKDIQLELKTKNGLHIKDEQFYALDLNALDEVSRIIRAGDGDVHDLSYKDGDLYCVVNGTQNDRLFLSIPYHKGWHITRNGKTIQPDSFGECLMVLPLEKGKNVIEMHYSIPYFKAGCMVSAFGLICLLLGSKANKFKMR